MNNIIWIVFDSARYDAFLAAHTPAIDRLGLAERRYSYASWTAPSHYAFLMGLTPHSNEPGCFASEVHRRDIATWQCRIGAPASQKISFANFVPYLSLPAYLKSLGYRTEAYVSMPVLNPQTLIAGHFDRFELMPKHNDLAAIIDRLDFNDQPRFYLINTGETHYPYALRDDKPNDLPHLSGLHGIWRDLDDLTRLPGERAFASSADFPFDTRSLKPLWDRQVTCIEYLDGVVADLLRRVPENTWIMVTSDHGELFGEDGYFGHGPVMHKKVFEVFFVEGSVHQGARVEPNRVADIQAADRDVTLWQLKRLGYL